MESMHSTEREGTETETDVADSFQALGLTEARLAPLEALGWTRPTPIQARAIPAGLEGRDVVGIAQTGTGKTGAFMIPAIEKIRAGEGLQVLVLCPTRELAAQVEEDAEALARGSSVRTACIVGGVGYGPQIEALERQVEIIAATPGRFNDHLNRGRVDLGNLRVLVLDEADRMLDMGFRPQIEEVLRRSPRGRQTMLYSATMPRGVHALALQVTRDPVWVKVAGGGSVAEGIREVAYPVRPEKKPDLLVHLLDEPGWDQVLVFTRTKAGADTLVSRLEREGVSTDALHSDREMRHRTRALERFAEGRTRVLVATDIAQRGLDVEGISHVVNYDVPTDPEDYVHRIGRTGRAGALGTAITFVASTDLGFLKSLEYRLGYPLDREHLPAFDYAGSPGNGDDAGQRGPRRHARSGSGFGSRSAEDLSEEELGKLLEGTS